MAKKTDFSSEEWDQLRELPSVAGLIVVAASPSGPIGLLKESAAAEQLTRQTLERAQTELLRELAADAKRSLHLPRLDATSPEEIRSKGLAACRQVASILRRVSPDEAQEYQFWIVELANRVAEATKEGGFLGFGGERVSPEESTAIEQIQIALR